jgi:hypothetical protein
MERYGIYEAVESGHFWRRVAIILAATRLSAAKKHCKNIAHNIVPVTNGLGQWTPYKKASHGAMVTSYGNTFDVRLIRE